jgi:hypothetical protein
MTEALANRGPDADGFYTPNWQIADSAQTWALERPTDRCTNLRLWPNVITNSHIRQSFATLRVAHLGAAAVIDLCFCPRCLRITARASDGRRHRLVDKMLQSSTDTGKTAIENRPCRIAMALRPRLSPNLIASR